MRKYRVSRGIRGMFVQFNTELYGPGKVARFRHLDQSEGGLKRGDEIHVERVSRLLVKLTLPSGRELHWTTLNLIDEEAQATTATPSQRATRDWFRRQGYPEHIARKLARIR